MREDVPQTTSLGGVHVGSSTSFALRRRPARPGVTAVGRALVAALACGVAAAGVLSAAPAAVADTTAVPGSLSTASQASITLAVPVAPGLRPSAVRGRLVVQPTVQGSVSFSIGDRIVREVPARNTAGLSIPVRLADVGADQAVDLTMTFKPGGRCPAPVAPAPVAFRDLSLVYEGSETRPTSLDSFFPNYAPRVDVVIPANASDDVLAAGLAAVGALSARYGSDTVVQLTTTGGVLPRTGPGQRVVRIAAGPGEVGTEVSARFGLPTVTITGNGAALREAAAALGSPRLRLASGQTTEGLSETGSGADVGLSRTLADLGSDRIVLTGPGPVTTFVGLKQDSFGGPIDELTVKVRGTHTVVPEGLEAQLNTYLNGFLLDSRMLDDDPELTFDVTADAGLIGPDNGLEFTLSTSGTDCTSSTLPIEVHIEGTRSTVEAQRGTGRLTGFGEFPQVLGGELPIAIRVDGPERTAAAIDAAQIVTALQRASARTLDVELVSADELVDGSESGLLVGASSADADALEAPLRLDGMRLLDYAEADFQVGTDEPFAALEAVQSEGRHVLLLGGWSPEGTSPSALTRKAASYVGTRGWGSLSSDLLVAGGDSPPFTIDSNIVVPQEQRAEERRGFIWWLVGGVALLLLLLALQVFRTSRRDRRVRQLVDAQQRADATGYDDDGRPTG